MKSPSARMKPLTNLWLMTRNCSLRERGSRRRNGRGLGYAGSQQDDQGNCRKDQAHEIPQSQLDRARAEFRYTYTDAMSLPIRTTR